MRSILLSELAAGDALADDSMVTVVYHDPDGTWVETDDGDAGYMIGPRVTILD